MGTQIHLMCEGENDIKVQNGSRARRVPVHPDSDNADGFLK